MLFPKINFARPEDSLKNDFKNYLKEVEEFLNECTDEIQINKISCFLFDLKNFYKSYFNE